MEEGSFEMVKPTSNWGKILSLLCLKSGPQPPMAQLFLSWCGSGTQQSQFYWLISFVFLSTLGNPFLGSSTVYMALDSSRGQSFFSLAVCQNARILDCLLDTSQVNIPALLILCPSVWSLSAACRIFAFYTVWGTLMWLKGQWIVMSRWGSAQSLCWPKASWEDWTFDFWIPVNLARFLPRWQPLRNAMSQVR